MMDPAEIARKLWKGLKTTHWPTVRDEAEEVLYMIGMKSMRFDRKLSIWIPEMIRVGYEFRVGARCYNYAATERGLSLGPNGIFRLIDTIRDFQADILDRRGKELLHIFQTH